MRTVLLRLEGPLQSWGVQGRFEVRDTELHPTKSGVVGLIAGAMGIARDDDDRIVELGRLPMAVRVDRPGQVLSDYHTVGGGTFLGRPYRLYDRLYGSKSGVAPTRRFYLADASFLVGVEVDDRELADRIVSSLRDPTWPIFLGRRSCVPSAPVFAGVEAGSCVEALQKAPLRVLPDGPRRVRLVIESEVGSPLQDVPLSFALYRRRHGRRWVGSTWIEPPVEEAP